MVGVLWTFRPPQQPIAGNGKSKGEDGVAEDPIKQFEISTIVPIEIANVDFSFTNSALFMVATTGTVAAFLMLSTQGRGLVPGRWQSAAEMSYEFVAGMLRDAAGREGMKFFPLVFSLFMFILIGNLFGMFPYFFTFTSQIIITFALAMLVIGTVIVYGFMKNGLNFLKLFVPSGVPIAVVPLVTAIEVISFLSRPISLSVRLFANMLAGHTALKVFAGFIVMLAGAGFVGIVGQVLAMVMTIAITGLEFLVSFLQAYVFAVLTCMYLNDAVHPDH